jgi:CubicO group peptidase (beta-lactamase class C family)
MHRARLPLLLLATMTASCGGTGNPTDFAPLAPFLDSLMSEAGVPGIEFAVFDDSGLLFEHVSGFKDVTTEEAVDSETAFEAASISKPLFAYLVLSLVEEGVLDLDTPLGELVSEVPEIAYDSRSSALTPRVLLTHVGGLPNWRSRLDLDAGEYSEMFAVGDTLRFQRDPGSAYGYSGEGYVLLQRVVEERTGSTLVELMEDRVFGPLGMTRSAMYFNAEMESNHARGHNREGSADKWVIGLPLASTTLHTTATDLARFGGHIAGLIRDGGPFAEMAEPAVALEGGDDEYWGLGFGVIDGEAGRYVWHGGNNVIFIADFIYGVEENLGYVVLTNSARGPRLVQALEERVFGRQVRR